MRTHKMVVKDWHRCCDKATKHIHCAVDRTSWIFVPGFVVITHCPFCGEKLPEIKLERVGSIPNEDG